MTPILITIRLRLLNSGGLAGARREAPASGGDRLPPRRDPESAVALPGSMVADSLRAHCAHWSGLPGSLFGGAPWERETVPSPIQVLGVRLHGAQPSVESTIRVTIDQHRDVPRMRALSTVEQLSAGTECDVHLRWDNAGDSLDCFLDAVWAWRPHIERGDPTGSGGCAVIGVESRSYDLTSPDGLLTWLAVGDPASYPQPTSQRNPCAQR